MKFPLDQKEFGFDNERYRRAQIKSLMRRLRLADRLYLEIGGKVFDDFHAMRVLPGFDSSVKVSVLEELGKKREIGVVVVLNADHVEKGKYFWDLGLSYAERAQSMAEEFENLGFFVEGFVINKFSGQRKAKALTARLRKTYRVYLRPFIEGYPDNLRAIFSERGFGKKPFFEFNSDIIVVVAPGPNSGKLTTALTGLYQDALSGIKSTYVKYETFPVWDLPLEHPVNIAYESATADIGDYNAIDLYHWKAYRIEAVNYNRDIEIFPVLKRVMDKIHEMGGHLPYSSPTDMGVNEISKGIVKEEIVIEAAKREINRRYFSYLQLFKEGVLSREVVERARKIMIKAGIDENYREVVRARGKLAYKGKSGLKVVKEAPPFSALAKFLLDVAGGKLEKEEVDRMVRLKLFLGKKALLSPYEVALLLDNIELNPGIDLHYKGYIDRDSRALLSRLGIAFSFEM